MSLTATQVHAVRAAADRLAEAELTGTPCSPVRDLIGRDDVDLAYAVQRIGTERRLDQGARVVGRKIGLTSPAVQRQLGVDQPDFGVLFDDLAVASGGTPGNEGVAGGGGGAVPAGRLLQPKAEAELAFVLGADLDRDDADVRAAVDYAVVALEIVDSRIAGWDISFADTVADNASSGLFVLGTQRLALADFEPRDIDMTMSIDGEQVSTGTGAACLGDPLNALAWLARTARDFGDPLRAGQIVLSGALGPMAAIGPGATVHAEITTGGRSLGTVGFSMEETS